MTTKLIEKLEILRKYGVSRYKDSEAEIEFFEDSQASPDEAKKDLSDADSGSGPDQEELLLSDPVAYEKSLIKGEML